MRGDVGKRTEGMGTKLRDAPQIPRDINPSSSFPTLSGNGGWCLQLHLKPTLPLLEPSNTFGHVRNAEVVIWVVASRGRPVYVQLL